MSKIIHNVFFKFADHVTKQQINFCFASLIQLKNAIPEIISIEYRTNLSKEGRDKGFSHLLQIEFADESALKKYLQHKAHTDAVNQLIQQKIISIDHSILVFDYSIP